MEEVMGYKGQARPINIMGKNRVQTIQWETYAPKRAAIPKQ